MNITKAFGIVLRQLRNERGWSQEKLASKSGFHRTYISLLERGEKTPSVETVYKFSESFSIPLSYLVLLVEEEMNKESRNQTGQQ